MRGYTYLHIIRKTEVTGCVYEDGADTREETSEFFIVPDTELEQFNEDCVDDYASQDYSYEVEYKEIAKIGYWEIEELIKKLQGFIDENKNHFGN